MTDENEKAPLGAAQRRLLKLQLVLAGHTFDGLKLVEVAEALKVNTPTALRDLRVMADEGFAERIPGMEDRWRLGPKGVQIWRAHELDLQRARARVDETNQRYSREPK